MRIFKTELAIVDRQTIKAPVGAVFLTAQMQDDLCLWFLCDESAEMKDRTIAIYGTGNQIPDEPGRYISTVQALGGKLVWHVFEVTPE